MFAAGQSRAVVEFRLLGPLEAVENGQPVHLGGRQQRALLAVMLLRRNEVVPTDELVDAIWGARPPPTAQVMVQLYVSRLRKLFGREPVVTRPAGYLLRGRCLSDRRGPLRDARGVGGRDRGRR